MRAGPRRAKKRQQPSLTALHRSRLKPPTPTGNVTARAGETTGEGKPDAAEAAKHDEAAPEQNIVEAKPAEVTLAPETGAQPVAAAKPEGDDAKPERTASTDDRRKKKPDAKIETKADEAPKAAEAPKAVEFAKPIEARTEPKVEVPKALEGPKTAETPKVETKPDTVKADVAKPDGATPAKKDETRITPPAKVIKESPRRTGQIAVFISGKDSKLYVRQNFVPLFDVPVTIAAGNRPLGYACVHGSGRQSRIPTPCIGRS